MEESYVKLAKLLGALQSCVLGIVIVAQIEFVFVFERGEIIPGIYGKYTSTSLIATPQDGANHCRRETTSAWDFS